MRESVTRVGTAAERVGRGHGAERDHAERGAQREWGEGTAQSGRWRAREGATHRVMLMAGNRGCIREPMVQLAARLGEWRQAGRLPRVLPPAARGRTSSPAW